MSMTSPTTNAVASPYVSAGTMYDDATMSAMSPEDIMNFVRIALGSIDAQLNDYKELVEKRQEKAADISKAMSILRAGIAPNGELRPDCISDEEYSRAMNLLTKHLDIPEVRSARNAFLESYGDYRSDMTMELPGSDDGVDDISGPNAVTKDGEVSSDLEKFVGGEWVNENRMMRADEFSGLMQNLQSGLESLNSDNEMIMMNVQKLMQQRNQVSQFASNMLKINDEMLMAIIGNLR